MGVSACLFSGYILECMNLALIQQKSKRDSDMVLATPDGERLPHVLPSHVIIDNGKRPRSRLLLETR